MYTFKVKHNHELDHLTPVVWKMMQQGYGCSLNLLKPEQQLQDYRVKFLLNSGAKLGTEGTPVDGLPHGVFFSKSALGETLGVPRYCPEWMFIHQGIYPRLGGLPESNYKIAIFLSNPTSKWVYKREQERIHGIYLPGASIYVQDHTRVCKPGPYESPELIDWADTVCVVSSSVGVEALIKGKNVYHLDYLHRRTSPYYRVCTNIRNYNDLLYKLRKRRDKKVVGLDGWLRDEVYHGSPDVLNRYVTHLSVTPNQTES